MRDPYEVHLDYRWQDRGVDVWLYVSHMQGTTIFYPSDDEMREVTIAAGAVFPEKPSLRLPADMLKALVDAAMPQFPPSEAMDRHLKDAMGVRDRLLTLIEKGQQ